MDNGSIRKVINSGYRNMKLAVFLVKRIGTRNYIVLLERKKRINEDLGEK